MPLSGHSGPGNGLKCNSLGKIRPQSSQLAESLWTDPGIKRANLQLKGKKERKKSAGWERIVEHSHKVLASEKKATTITMVTLLYLL